MTIAVTAATGHLGQLVIESLLNRGVPANDIVAVVRSPEKAAGLGVQVRQASYDDPQALTAALAGVDKLLLISGTEFGQRLRQHSNVVDAAKAAGVGLIAYTSILRADTTQNPIAPEHKATEEYIVASGLPYVFLRNSWYHEIYTENLGPALEHGALIGAAGEGKVSAAPRADYAEAAAVVLTTDGPTNIAYELGGDVAFTQADLAAEVSRQSGKPVVYQNLSVDEYAKALAGFGLPEQAANTFAHVDVDVAAGGLFVDSGDLSRLLGRPTTPLADSVARALK